MTRSVRIVLLGLAALLGAASSPLSAQAPKVGFVNIQQIMAQAPGLAEARTTFETEVQRAQPELQRMAAQFDSLQADFQRQQATLAEAARAQRQQDLQTRYNTLQQRQAALQQREQELLAPITQRVEAAIEEVRRAGNYALIFDSAESGIVAADQSLDVTSAVLARLQAAPAAPAAPTP